MQPGETVSRSTLDKPLHQLTEDDISQLTREDCRRYLKEKGMRRPSWNKSQAIQQVISLKTLLEATPETESPRPRLYIPRPPPHPPDSTPSVPPNSSVSARGASANTPISVSADELVPYRQHDPPNPDVSADPLPPVHAAATENDSAFSKVVPSFVYAISDDDYSANAGMFDSNVDSVCLLLVWINITTGMAIESAGQMTIFYCGKVNVYDDVPRDKAQAIMHLAASPFAPPQDASSDVIPTLRPFQCQLETPGVKAAPNSIVANFPTPPTVKGTDNGKLPWEESSIAREDNLEGSTSRKASLQRYFEKKKDR
ncbi:PROTEIN TIFY 4A-RELATED-RELATED [Salix viminalis]|nr:PROTEIN TIFY 4A-RELATED-RELATED [Salix viminalis]